MTFLQINIMLMTITVILASLMGACLLYSMKTMRTRLAKINKKNESKDKIGEKHVTRSKTSQENF